MSNVDGSVRRGNIGILSQIRHARCSAGELMVSWWHVEHLPRRGADMVPCGVDGEGGHDRSARVVCGVCTRVCVYEQVSAKVSTVYEASVRLLLMFECNVCDVMQGRMGQ